jgi:hypothetical protein
MTFVRVAARDSRGMEAAWFCNGCDRAVTSMFAGLCTPCQRAERRHREIVEALKNQGVKDE